MNREFLVDLVGMTAISATTIILLWLPAILAS